MKKINLAITGCLGRMGQQLIISAKSDKKFKLITLTENQLIKKKISGIRPSLNNLDSFDHNSFDIVTMLDFIEHIEDDEAIGMLNNIYNFLKPGAKLILTTPNYRSLYTILEMIVNVVGPVSFKEQHINKFNARRLNELLKTSKFQYVKVDKFLNFSCFLSIFSVSLAQKLENIIDKIFYGFFGYVLVAELKK